MSEVKLPPLPDEAFDGEKESTEINFVKCEHDYEIISANEIKCKKCHSGLIGQGVTRLLKR